MTNTCRFAEFSIERGPLGCEVTINSIDTARVLFLKDTQRRYRPLTALLRSALGHRVMIVADGEEWSRTHDAIVPHLQSASVAQQCRPVIEFVAGRFFGALAERSADSPHVPAPIDIDVESSMRAIIASIMGYVLFGEPLAFEEAEYLEKL